MTLNDPHDRPARHSRFFQHWCHGVGIVIIMFSPLVIASDTADSRQLLNTEIEYITELLQHNRLSLAETHLAIIESTFPEKVSIIRYYQAVIAYSRADYTNAVQQFRRLRADTDAPFNRHTIDDYIFRCLCRLGEFDDAQRLLNSKPVAPWQNNAPLLLGMAMLDRAKRSDGGTNDALYHRGLAMLVDFATQNPQHERAAWIHFLDAETAYTRLEKRLSHLASKSTTEPFSLTTRQAINRVLARYRYIRHHYPDSHEATRARFRLNQLAPLLETTTQP